MPPVQLKKPIFKAPKKAPDWREGDLDEQYKELKMHLQTAVILEMYTIPLYLFAAYSIKNSPQSTYLFISELSAIIYNPSRQLMALLRRREAGDVAYGSRWEHPLLHWRHSQSVRARLHSQVSSRDFLRAH